MPVELGQSIADDCAGLARVLVTDQGCTIQLVPLEAGKLADMEPTNENLEAIARKLVLE